MALEKILRTAQFTVEDHQEAWLAFRDYQNGADFADALIAAINRRFGCGVSVTFDRKSKPSTRFRRFVTLWPVRPRKGRHEGWTVAR